MGLLIAPVKADEAPLGAINKALQNLPLQSGRFSQIQANGHQLRGDYHMDWPQRLRFNYDNGGPVITVKGKFIAVQDAPRLEPNWLPVGLTPLALIRDVVRDGIKSEMIVETDETAQSWAITLTDPSGDTPGQAILFFTKNSLTLYGWQLTDVQNLVTRLWLTEISIKAQLEAALFSVDYDETDDD